MNLKGRGSRPKLYLREDGRTCTLRQGLKILKVAAALAHRRLNERCGHFLCIKITKHHMLSSSGAHFNCLFYRIILNGCPSRFSPHWPFSCNKTALPGLRRGRRCDGRAHPLRLTLGVEVGPGAAALGARRRHLFLHLPAEPEDRSLRYREACGEWPGRAGPG